MNGLKGYMARIRELEAELVDGRIREYEQLRRAEIAEARMFSDAEEILQLKARVAELERAEEFWHNEALMRVPEPGLTLMIEKARERED